MRRRDFLAIAVALSIMPLRARAQSAKNYRLGSLTPGQPISADSPLGMVLLKGLEQQGFRVGKNLTYDARGAAGQNAKLPELVRAMRADHVDVIVAVGYPTAVACKIEELPTVVAWGSGDPLATHLVTALAHPGGAITGIADDATTLSTKRLDLIKQAVPNLKQIAMLWNRDDLGMSMRFDASADAARSMGATVQALGVREPDDFRGVFEAMDRSRPDAIMMVSDSLTTLNRKRVFDYAAAHRIPALYEYDVLARAGGLMSYGPDLKESVERAADLVARIFKGARPADLPFEQPTRYLFLVNLKTAKASGIELPANLVALADEVID
jgi:putative tryptophan/tyrosine transport system substrate-binding protein